MLSKPFKPEPYLYLRLVAQLLNVLFAYVEPRKQNAKRDIKGQIQFTIQIADRTYGPFLTVYRCTETQWQSRKSPRPSLAGKRLRTRLGDLSSRLIAAWRSYSGTKEPITAAMLFQKGAFTVIQLVEGGAVYVL